MPGGSFVDTNIWVYAHLDSPDDARHSRALELVCGLTDGVISPQVAAEYYNVMRRARREDSWIQENLSAVLGYVRCQAMDSALIRRSWAIRNRFGLSHWDAQIVAAALTAGCDTLYTEDLQHGQRIDGMIIIDPFKPAPEAHSA
ncbi:PIN domain-containing protein [uncultured Thiodictyon sp.]|jgi:predicted nucleic acid-binding protein|uniref:PIN domain-containing protein n=1 Tax=uncultured Thiodictyon sp. TaxID=1846217 RepID=UPI0025E5D720|nr:PIN domain-containing protein [uncultured Thiodictyon sp.]